MFIHKQKPEYKGVGENRVIFNEVTHFDNTVQANMFQAYTETDPDSKTIRGLPVASIAGNPSSLTEGDLWYNSTSQKLYFRKSATTIELGLGSSGGSTDLDGAYTNGQAIDMDQGPLTLNDETTGSLNTLAIVKTGAGSGNLLDISVDAALTGSAVNIDMNLGIAAPAITIDNGATARTGSDIVVTDDSTGTHSVIDINSSGSGTSTGLDWTGSYAGSPAGNAISLTFDNSDNLDTGGLLITRGTGVRAASAIAIVDGSTGSSNLVDINVTGVFTGNIIDITTSAAATANALFIDLDAAVAMTALHIEGSGVRTQPFIELITDSTSSASLIDISVDGAITGTAAIDIDMNAGLAASAIYIDAGAGTRTANLIEIKDDGDGDVDTISIIAANTGSGSILDLNVTGVRTGNIFDIALSGAVTGDVIALDMDAAVASAALTIDAGGGTRTVDLIDVTFDGDGNVGLLDVNVTNTGSGTLFAIDITGVHTGNCLAITYSSAASTGDAVTLAMGTNVAGSALVLTAAGARTDDLVKIDDSSTSDSHVFDINFSGIYTGNCIDITYGTAAATGNAINIATGTNLAGNAISITTAGARTAPVFLVTGGATDGGTDDHIFDINQTGVLNSNVIDITYDTGASDGNAIDLNMGTNVAGSAIDIASAGTGDGSVINIAHTGALADGSAAVKISSTGDYAAADGNLVELVQATGAGVAGNNVLYISATGANVEAIEIAAGLVFLATVTANGSGNNETLSTAANVSFYDPSGASRTGVILSPGLRDGQHVKVVNIADGAENITFAAAGTSNVANGVTSVINQNEALEFVWHASTALWYPLATVFS